MNAYSGKIVGADSDEKTITIECPNGVSGVVIGEQVLITPWFDLETKAKDKSSKEELRKCTLKEVQGINEL